MAIFLKGNRGQNLPIIQGNKPPISPILAAATSLWNVVLNLLRCSLPPPVKEWFLQFWGRGPLEHCGGRAAADCGLL